MSARELRQLIADNEAWLRRPENRGQTIILHGRTRSSQRHQERPSTSHGRQSDNNAVTERRGRWARDPPRRRGQEESRERSRSPLRPAPAEPCTSTGESSRDGGRPLPPIQWQEVGVMTPPLPQAPQEQAPRAQNVPVQMGWISPRELRQLIPDSEAWLRRPEIRGQTIILHGRTRSPQRDQERRSTSHGRQSDNNAVTERRGRWARDPPRRRGQEESRERSRSPLRPAPAEPSTSRGESSRDGGRPLPPIQRQEVDVMTPPLPQAPQEQAPPAQNIPVQMGWISRIGRRKLQIANLPTKVVTPQEEVQSCVICMTEYEVGEQVTVLPCNHIFHKGCVCRWLRSSSLCPLCRHQCLQ
ncbi:uncharacterized protein LOC143808388 [Ranitomeya variabilis]|uniref:uncharacterized protein LOC143808388 n=1 Tax=Ranitomeya variabilis TaxID=490064 RepID=UPI0040565383